MPVYVRFAAIENKAGEQDANHVGWFQALELRYDPNDRRPHLELVFPFDAVAAQLGQLAAFKKPLTEVEIHLMDEGALEPYVKYRLEHAAATTFAPTDRHYVLELDFDRVHVEHTGTPHS